jgi:HSP20 family protein
MIPKAQHVESSHKAEGDGARPAQAEGVAAETVAPSIDIAETETGWLLVADMPGVAKDGIDVQVERGVLSISGRCGCESPKARTVYEGFRRVNYFRSVALSDEVDRARITAAQNDGVLTVVLPKAAAAQTRKINVQVVGG